MIKNLVLISQTYIGLGSDIILGMLSSRVKITLFISESEDVDERVLPYLDKIHKVSSSLDSSLRPVLSHENIIEILLDEISDINPSNSFSIFCQQEDNVLTAAYVREALNIKGDLPSDMLKFRDKLLMKEIVGKLMSNSIPKHTCLDVGRAKSSEKEYYENLTKTLGEILVIKPTSGAGSVNVKIVNNLYDFQNFIEMIEDNKYNFSYEVDEFIEGKMYQCDSIVVDGKVYFSGILELGCSNFDFVLGKPLSVFPVLDKKLCERLSIFNQSVIDALGFRNGSTHLEVFVSNDNGKITFLEIAARVPGGIGVPYHKKNSNVNMVDATLLLSCGLDIKQYIKPKFSNNVVSALLPVQNGKVLELLEPRLQSQYELQWHISVGDIVESNSLVDTAGVLTFFNDDLVQLRADFESLQAYCPVRAVEI
ncbi:hypothetical protein BCT01_24200 [Vibrio tasmaniensis]|uniref:ATP-grasp domain-containing protein n=1 Tax=Vibrio TaxID=662 RepID=UPI000CC8217F|nr:MULTISPECIES: ATP-grasp domain-containing protein [Vibrio]MCW4446276.1 ATP-grasp domain-containing protein [Vibrio splendidus]PMO84489.1 hypothetical protein BCT01_24200 [Vibrio tasmaniensis]